MRNKLTKTMIIIPGLILALSSKSEASKAKIDMSITPYGIEIRNDKNLNNSNIIDTLKKDKEIFDILDEKDDSFFKIDYYGKEAYIGKSLVEYLGKEKSTKHTKLYKEASDKSDVLKFINKGDFCEIQDSTLDNDFIKVLFDGRIGYVHKSSFDKYKNKTTEDDKPVEIKKEEKKKLERTVEQYNQTNSENNNGQETTIDQEIGDYTGETNDAKEWIAQRESNGSYNARNGRYIGRYQLDSAYLNGDHSPENQERVADNYVKNRYGSWENAKVFWENNGWY